MGFNVRWRMSRTSSRLPRDWWHCIGKPGRDSRYVDLLRGKEPYKLRWSSGTIRTHRLILGQHWAAWMPYAGYRALRSRAKLYARSENAPRWIKAAKGKYRTLRRRVNRSWNELGGRLRHS
jgi:hypothetical protein